MNIVVAPDSFKGSLTALQVASTMKKAILAVHPTYHVKEIPMADGGEGTVEAFLSALDGERVEINCRGPLGDSIVTEYGVIAGKTAIIECANIAGITQVPREARNPDLTTTYGIGEVIIDALDKQCDSIIIGLGGSATNDGGLGMLLALGMKAYDSQGKEVHIFGEAVQQVAKVDFSSLDPRLKDIDLKIASDVDNPLYGENGASVIYGPQKGATSTQVKLYDKALQKFSQLVEATIGRKSLHLAEGAGAAGGLGFGMLVIGGEIVSGAELIAEKLFLEDAIREADVVLTGEGQSDHQTLSGKAPGYIGSLGEKHGVPVILISGGLQDLEQLSTVFTGSFSIVPGPLSIEESLNKSEILLTNQTKQVVKCLSHFW